MVLPIKSFDEIFQCLYSYLCISIKVYISFIHIHSLRRDRSTSYVHYEKFVSLKSASRKGFPINLKQIFKYLE